MKGEFFSLEVEISLRMNAAIFRHTIRGSFIHQSGSQTPWITMIQVTWKCQICVSSKYKKDVAQWGKPFWFIHKFALILTSKLEHDTTIPATTRYLQSQSEFSLKNENWTNLQTNIHPTLALELKLEWNTSATQGRFSLTWSFLRMWVSCKNTGSDLRRFRWANTLDSLDRAPQALDVPADKP